MNENYDIDYDYPKEIQGLTFVKTCYACPEQYDVFNDKGEQVGYIRLRHGNLTVECPDVGGTRVYSDNPEGDGIFLDYERGFYLTEAATAINKYILLV